MLTCGVIITSSGEVCIIYTVLGHVVSLYTFIYWSYYTLLLKGSHISILIASMSDCTVCRLESICDWRIQSWIL